MRSILPLMRKVRKLHRQYDNLLAEASHAYVIGKVDLARQIRGKASELEDKIASLESKLTLRERQQVRKGGGG